MPGTASRPRMQLRCWRASRNRPRCALQASALAAGYKAANFSTYVIVLHMLLLLVPLRMQFIRSMGPGHILAVWLCAGFTCLQCSGPFCITAEHSLGRQVLACSMH